MLRTSPRPPANPRPPCALHALETALHRTILGSGTFAMASAAADSGLVVYGILLLCVGFMAEQSISMLMLSMEHAKVNTFPGLGRAAYGAVGEKSAIISVIIQQLGATIAFMQIIGTVVTPLVSKINHGHGLLAQKAFWQALLATLVIFPLCMLPRITSLRYSSVASVCLTLSFVGVIVIDGCAQLAKHWSAAESTDVYQHGVDWSAVPAGPSSFVHVLLAIPVLAFAQVCQMNVFPVVSELKEPTPARLSAVSKGSIIMTAVVYALSGYFGFFIFGTRVDADVLQSYEDMQASADSHQQSVVVPAIVVKVLQFGIGMALTMSFPVVAYELRHSIEFVLVKHAPFNWLRHTLINIFIVAVSTIVAILVPEISVVFGFAGATTSCLIVFILPAFFYLRVAPGPIQDHWRSKVAVVILAVGILLVPACLAAQGLKQARKD